jgi:hypothetical protein
LFIDSAAAAGPSVCISRIIDSSALRSVAAPATWEMTSALSWNLRAALKAPTLMSSRHSAMWTLGSIGSAISRFCRAWNLPMASSGRPFGDYGRGNRRCFLVARIELARRRELFPEVLVVAALAKEQGRIERQATADSRINPLVRDELVVDLKPIVGVLGLV